MSEEEDSNMNSSASTQSDQQMELLTKSKESLYQALDRLEVDRNEVSFIIIHLFLKKVEVV